MVYLQDGFYTKTQAYNLLKKFLGVSRKVLINRIFFSLFFKESDGLYLIEKSEGFVRDMFIEKNVSELNGKYYKKKSEGELGEAQKIRKEIMRIVQESLAT